MLLCREREEETAEAKERRGSSNSPSSSSEEEARSWGTAVERRLYDSKKASSSSTSPRPSQFIVSVFRRSMAVHWRENRGWGMNVVALGLNLVFCLWFRFGVWGQRK